MALLSARARRAFATRPFWLSLGVFVVFGTIVDTIAIRWNWWQWSAVKTCGILILDIPVEEYILFVIGHATLVATWETLDDMA